MDNAHLLGRPFTAATAAAAGLSRARLRAMVSTGQVRHVLRGVYVDQGVADDIALRAAAASLILPSHAVVADRSAAWLHGVDILEFGEHLLVPALDVVSRDGRPPSHRRGIFGGQRDLLPDEITFVDGVAVTTPLRTACDVACLRGRLRAMATIDAFRRVHGLRAADFWSIVPRYVGRRGVIQLRELIPLSTYLADSQPESWIRLMIHDHGLPMPAAQVWALVPGWGQVRMENAWEQLRIAVEYDGEANHTLDEDRAHDDERRAALTEMGWTVFVLRKGDLAARRREQWLREVENALNERSPKPVTKRIYSRGPDQPSYRWPRRW